MEASGSPQSRDEQRLAELGYKQELPRGWTRFTNFAISFSIISVLAGCFTVFYVGWNNGGPMVISIFTWDNQDHGWTVDNTAEVLIARLAKAIVDVWSPQGLDAKALVPGLGLPAAR